MEVQSSGRECVIGDEEAYMTPHVLGYHSTDRRIDEWMTSGLEGPIGQEWFGNEK